MFGALGRVSAVLWVVLRGLVVLESPRGRRRQLRAASGFKAVLRRKALLSDSKTVSWVSEATLGLEFE